VEISRMAKTRGRNSVTSCALQAAQFFDAVVVWVVCVIPRRSEALSGGLLVYSFWRPKCAIAICFPQLGIYLSGRTQRCL